MPYKDELTENKKSKEIDIIPKRVSNVTSMENLKVNKERVNYNKKIIPVISMSNLIASILALIPS